MFHVTHNIFDFHPHTDLYALLRMEVTRENQDRLLCRTHLFGACPRRCAIPRPHQFRNPADGANRTGPHLRSQGPEVQRRNEAHQSLALVHGRRSERGVA